MGRVGLAVMVFFRILRDVKFAEQAHRLLEGAAPPQPTATRVAPAVAPEPLPARKETARNDALNLLSVLQRESRLIDFLKESITAYSDAQIGAAVRDVHRDAASALERIAALRPVMTEEEGSRVEVPAGSDAARVRLVGNVTGQPPFRGVLRHAGWQATKLELPEWTGNSQSSRVIAPAEVEL